MTLGNETTSRGGKHPRVVFPPAKEREPDHAAPEGESGKELVASTEFASYALQDPLGCEIGKVEKVFVNDRGEPEYVAVKTGLFKRKTTLIPVESVSVNGGRQALILQ